MGFLNKNDGSKTSIYLETTETAKSIRPTTDKPTPVWVHTIPEVKTTGPDGKDLVLRKFATEICTSNSRNGTGCQCCSTQDPLWHMLDAQTKVNRRGQRVDFPKKCINLLPVFDHSVAGVRLMKGGNQSYEVMDQWFSSQQGAGQDLRRCDWQIWKSGKGIKTKYTVVRQDATPFQFTADMVNEGQTLLQRALQDLAPAAPEAFKARISGESSDQNQNAVTQFATSQVVSNPLTAVTATSSGYVSPGATVASSTPPVVVSAPPMSPTIPTPTPAPTQGVGAAVLSEFTLWLNSQPEFTGRGIINNLLPVLKEQLGGGNTDYHSCTPDQLAALRQALTQKLEVLRKRS